MKEIIVYTPNGDDIKLPEGSTILDFAYSIHSELGNKCVGAEIKREGITKYIRI